MTKTVVFDLDGTLADTSEDLIAAANAVFEGRGKGRPLDPRADALTAFRGGRAMLELGYARVGKGAQPEADYTDFLGIYQDALDRHTVLYPGVVDCIEVLRADGYRVSVCTNKPEAMADKLLRSLAVRDLFHALVGADTFPQRKPDPVPYVASVERAGGAVARSFIVGDTETDVKTARAVGVPVVLVGFGPEGDAVNRLAPDHIIRTFDELPAVASGLVG